MSEVDSAFNESCCLKIQRLIQSYIEREDELKLLMAKALVINLLKQNNLQQIFCLKRFFEQYPTNSAHIEDIRDKILDSLNL